MASSTTTMQSEVSECHLSKEIKETLADIKKKFNNKTRSMQRELQAVNKEVSGVKRACDGMKDVLITMEGKIQEK